MNNHYLQSAIQQFENYKKLGDKTFAQLNGEQLCWQYNRQSNSIATIVKHMHGNMLSRWTNFLTTDGEKEWRERDAEFEADITGKDEIIQKWNEGWDCLFNALTSLSEADLAKHITIRNQKHTVVEAINRQLTHYASHVGQMMYIGKMLCGENWQPLSMPKGESKKFNDEKFSRPH